MAMCARACRRTVATTEIRFWGGVFDAAGAGQFADTREIAVCGRSFTRGEDTHGPHAPGERRTARDAASAAGPGEHAPHARCAPRRPHVPADDGQLNLPGGQC